MGFGGWSGGSGGTAADALKLGGHTADWWNKKGKRHLYEWLSDAEIVAVVARTNVDMSAHFQEAVDAVGNGTLVLPYGTIRATNINLPNSINIEGCGWGMDSDSPYTPGTVVYNTSTTTPVFNIDSQLHASHYDTGAKLSNFQIHGNGSGTATPNGSSDIGVYVRGESNVVLDRLLIYKTGSYGVMIDQSSNKTTVQNCKIAYCTGVGVYAKQLAATGQILSIKVLNNEIDHNFSHGVAVWGQATTIERNTIQGNAGAGIYLGYDDAGTGNTSCQGTWIAHNYLEMNAQGNIWGRTQYASGPPIHYIQDLSIIDNWFYGDAGVTDIKLECANAWASIPTYRGCYIGPNSFNQATVRPWIDLSGDHDSNTVVQLPYMRSVVFASYIQGLVNTGGTSARILPSIERTSGGPERTSADYMGQYSRDTANGVYSRAVAVGGGASDWKPTQQYYADAAPTRYVYPRGTVFWHTTATAGTPVYWIQVTSGASYSTTRADSTVYAANVYATWTTGTTVWEVTAGGGGTTAASPPSITGKVVGDTVVDGGITWTCRSLTQATWVAGANL